MSNVPQDVINEYKSYGIEEVVIIQAWAACNGNKALLLDSISQIQEENQKALQQIQNQGFAPHTEQEQDVQLQKAYLESIQEAKANDYTFEPLNPEQRVRNNGTPVGLKNVGNKILSFTEPQLNLKEDDPDLKRIKAGIKLVSNLQKVFTQMISSDKKYVDPSEVIKNIVDEQGQVLPIGEQKDIGEFMICFLSTLDEGLKQQEKYRNQMDIENEQTSENIQFQNTGESLMSSQTSSNQGFKPLVRQHSSCIKEDSIINQLFFGKSQVKLTYPLGEELKNNIKDELFNIIFLDIKFKNMYTAWDEFIINEIDEYKNDKGDLVKAQKEFWIKKQPSTLFFQLKRVYYDVEAQMAKKSNEPFNFEKTIYIDRFMLNNNEQYMQIRKKVKQFQAKYDQLDEALEKLTKYGTKGLNLDNILEGSQEFLKQQQQSIDIEGQDIIQNPTQFTQNPQVLQAIQVLQSYQNQVQQRIQELKNQMNNIEKEIDQSYNQFKVIGYRLQSILIHDGYGADSGHYYSFLYDFQDEKWRRYNDQNIKEVTEEEVMKEAVGGHGHASAYCLVYVSEEQITKEKNASQSIALRSYYNEENQIQKGDLYYKMIPAELKNWVKEDNSKFSIEIQEYKTNQLVKSIIDSYVQKFELVNSLKRKSDELKNKIGHKFSPPALINYCVYLKDQPNINNLDNIVKYQILDTCVRELHEKKQSLWELQEEKQFLQKLESACKNLGQFKQPPLQLSQNDQDLLDGQLTVYLENIQNAVACVYFMQNIVKNDFQRGLFGLSYMLNQRQQDNNSQSPKYFQKLSRDSIFVIIVSAFQHIDSLVQQTPQDFQAIYQLIQTTIAFHNLYAKQDKFQTVVKIWVTDIASAFEQENKDKIQSLNDSIIQNGEQYKEGYELLLSNEQELMEQLEKNTHEGDPYNWNMNKQEDVHMQDVLSQFGKYKERVINSIKLNKLIQESQVPVVKQDREKYI